MIQKDYIIQQLKGFAWRDALLRVSGLFSGTAVLAVISLLPGFGPFTLPLAAGLYLLITASLEGPIRTYAAQLSPEKATELGLNLKLLVALFLVVILLTSQIHAAWPIWTLLLAIAFFDGCASALLVNSHSHFYLSFFQRGQSANLIAENLLNWSAPFSFNWRLMIPTLVGLGYFLALEPLEKLQVGSFNPGLPLTLILLIFRAWNRFQFHLDQKQLLLTETTMEMPPIQQSGPCSFLQIKLRIFEDPKNFSLYFLSALLNFCAISYLIGVAIQSLKALYMNPAETWFWALILSTLIYYLRGLAHRWILPLLSRRVVNLALPGIGFIIIILAVSLAGVSSLGTTGLSQSILYSVITGLLFSVSDTLNKSFESTLTHRLNSNERAAWQWLGNVSAQTVLACTLIMGFILQPQHILFTVSILIGAAGIGVIAIELYSTSRLESSTFSTFMNRWLAKTVFLVAVLFFIFDTTTYYSATQKRIKASQNHTTQTILIGVKQSLLTGDFAGAREFLNSLKTGQYMTCFMLQAFNSQLNDCELSKADINNSEKLDLDLSYDNKVFGKVSLYFHLGTLRKDYFQRTLFDLFVSLIIYFVLFFAFRNGGKLLSSEVERIHRSLRRTEEHFGQFKIEEFNEIYLQIQETLKSREAISRQSALVELANQVSHDIRSPIAAINMLVNDLTEFTDEKRELAKMAIDRMNHIANDLLSKRKFIQQSPLTTEVSIELEKSFHSLPVDLCQVANNLIKEKRLQFSHRPYVEFHLDIEVDVSTCFILAEPGEIGRVLSNLLNNAIESLIEDRGLIAIHIQKTETQLRITISDTGRGIPKTILQLLGHETVSFGKLGNQSGNGLGVYHAKKTIEKYQGQLFIDSEENRGTRVHLIFPLMSLSLPPGKNPTWQEASPEHYQLESNSSSHLAHENSRSL